MVLGTTPAADGLPCAAAPEECNPITDTFITFNVTIVGEGAVDICGYALTFTGSGGSTTVGPPFAGPSFTEARPDPGYAFAGWSGGVLSGTTSPILYFYVPVECQNTVYNITATFEAT
jgi:hypothetical protein